MWKKHSFGPREKVKIFNVVRGSSQERKSRRGKACMGGKEGFRMAKGPKKCYLGENREEGKQTNTYCWKCLVPSKLSSCLLCGIKG